MSDFKTILKTHETSTLRSLISDANKTIRSKISSEIKEERKKFSNEMMKQRQAKKEERIIKIVKGSKREDIINLIVKNKKHFNTISKGSFDENAPKVKKEKKKKETPSTQSSEGKTLDTKITKLKKNINKMDTKQLKQLSIMYMDYKNIVGLNNMKHKGIVREIYKREQELKNKAKNPTIKITEAEKETGGGKADPKAKPYKIPKPTSKIRVVPKKKNAKETHKMPDGSVMDGKKHPKKEMNFKVKKSDGSVKEIGQKKPRPPTIKITEEEIIKGGKKKEKQKEIKSSLPPIKKMNMKFTFTKKSNEPTEQIKKVQEKALTQLAKSKPTEKKETTLQKLRRIKRESINKDKGKFIKVIENNPDKKKAFTKYMKEEYPDEGFDLEDQREVFSFFFDLDQNLQEKPTSRIYLNEMDDKDKTLMSVLFSSNYIYYIDEETDPTGLKEKANKEREKAKKEKLKKEKEKAKAEKSKEPNEETSKKKKGLKIEQSINITSKKKMTNISPKELYENEIERISVDDKLKPNYKKINTEILNQILLINPKLNDENQKLLKEFISAISQNALEEGQIDQSDLYLKDLFKPNIIKKGGNDAINKRLKKRRIRFQGDSGL